MRLAAAHSPINPPAVTMRAPAAIPALTTAQRLAATNLVILTRITGLKIERLEAIFRVAATANPLVPVDTDAYAELTRRERRVAVSAALAARMAFPLDDLESPELVLAHLAQPFAIRRLLETWRDEQLEDLVKEQLKGHP